MCYNAQCKDEGNQQRGGPRQKIESLTGTFRSCEKKGTCIPACWTSIDFRSRIYADFDLDTSYKGKKYSRIKSFYKKYHHLPRPIIISSNNILLDGYLILMFAKNKGIKKVPIIVLENVIVE